jgi:hypothetical protein
LAWQQNKLFEGEKPGSISSREQKSVKEKPEQMLFVIVEILSVFSPVVPLGSFRRLLGAVAKFRYEYIGVVTRVTNNFLEKR